MNSDDRIKWMIIHSTGKGSHDGECIVYEGTHADAQQFVSDTTYGNDRNQGLFSLMIPLNIITKALNKHMLTLKDLDLSL